MLPKGTILRHTAPGGNEYFYRLIKDTDDALFASDAEVYACGELFHIGHVRHEVCKISNEDEFMLWKLTF